jgi:hypothetical protein
MAHNTDAMILSSVFAGLAAISLSKLFLLVLALFIFWPLARSLARAGPQQQRMLVFPRMHFSEMPSGQAFGNDAALIPRAIRDTPAASISTWAGKGKSPIGDTLLFEFTDEPRSSNRSIPSVVIAFATPTMLPEFEIAHRLLLDRWFKQQPIVAGPVAGAPDPTMKVNIGPFKLIGRSLNAPMLQPLDMAEHPEFAKKYGVWASDAAAFGPRLKPALIERLCAMKKQDLHIKSWRNWLFIYLRAGRRIAPEQYPALLDEAVQLARMILQ